MSSTVHLHVGVAKTGTTFLQRVLFVNRDLLADNGVLYPGDRRSSHFLASLDLRGALFQGHEYAGRTGAWDRLTREVSGFSGTAVISHETLARTSPEAIQTAVTSFEGADVRVIVSARDLSRQIPAVWQERVKNRSEQPYEAFLEAVLGTGGDTAFTGGFWRVQWIPRVVSRWSAAVGAEHVTLVTVPPPGSEPLELWRRFAAAAELPDLPYDFTIRSSNTSLGMAEAELLRRLNGDLADLSWPQYERRIKRRFAEDMLLRHGTGMRIAVPGRWQDQVTRISEDAIEQLTASGVKVVGDLADLAPELGAKAAPVPEVNEQDVSLLASRLLADYAARPESGSGDQPATIVDQLRHRVALRPRWNRLRGRWRNG